MPQTKTSRRSALQFLAFAGGAAALTRCTYQAPADCPEPQQFPDAGPDPEPEEPRPWFDLGIVGDPIMDNQLLWHLSQTWSQQADVGEVLDTGHRIDGANPWSWPNQWVKTADRVRAIAEASEANGRLVSAGETYLRAADYYRAALIHHPEPAHPGVLATTQAATAAYAKAVQLLTLPAQAIEIPYESTTLPGHFFRSPFAAAKAPVLIAFEGRDAWPEETKYLADAAMRRGYHYLAFHGPGQGRAIREQGLPFRADWEKVVTPVVDAALAQPGVDPDRLVLMGISMGGALAPRAVAFEKRIAICVANPGVYSWAEAINGSLGAYSPELAAAAGDPAAFDAIAAQLIEAVPLFRWWFNDSMWKHGASSPSDLMAKLQAFTNADVVDQIGCDVLVMDGEAEAFSPGQAKKLYDALSSPKEYMLFTAEDTGLVHCQTGAMGVATQRMFDWLDARL